MAIRAAVRNLNLSRQSSKQRIAAYERKYGQPVTEEQMHDIVDILQEIVNISEWEVAIELGISDEQAHDWLSNDIAQHFSSSSVQTIIRAMLDDPQTNVVHAAFG